MKSDFVMLAAEEAVGVYSRHATHTDLLFSSELKSFKPFGDLHAIAKYKLDESIAVVAFRGSDNPLNWIFANFQAFFTRLAVIDPSLRMSGQTLRINCAEIVRPFGGLIHQGFARAFSWLWYGTDILLEPEPATKAEAWRRVLLHGLLITLFPLIWYAGNKFNFFNLSFYWPLAAAFASYVVIVNWERGTFEALNRPSSDQEQNDPLRSQLEKLNRQSTVIFTGHSLGGAMATLAFGTYRLWCKSDAARSDNGLLITFGCPRLGDKAFVDDFETEHHSRFLHVVNAGDPVPEVPPVSNDSNDAPMLWKRGLIGLVAAVLIAPLWKLYALGYGLTPPGRWSARNIYYSKGAEAQLWPWDHLSRNYLSLARSLKGGVDMGEHGAA